MMPTRISTKYLKNVAMAFDAFIPILVYNYAFKSNQMGMASALAWIMFVIVCILTIIAFTSQKKWVYYSDER